MSSHPRPTTIFPSSSSTGASNTTSFIRQSSLGGSGSGSINAQSSALASRIAAKRQELENLKQLRDLSTNLASQLAMLESKLATLRDGTESVACILANWDNVLRAISMASTGVPKPPSEDPGLPVTLVRMPVKQRPEDGR